MFNNFRYKSLTLIAVFTLLITSCGSGNATESAQEANGIQTSVAQTVAALNCPPEGCGSSNSPTPELPTFTPTPLQFSPTLTPLAPAVAPTRTRSPGVSECAQASLVSETIPDGTIFAPGQAFTKTWEIKNTSTCSWDTSYKIIFWDGDVLGGAYVYNLPQAVDPGQTVPISLLLTAPQAAANYTSKWMLQTPDSVEFGVGQYNAPFYANIVVSTDAKPNFGITSVEYKLERDPATGCPANVRFIVYATITTNGPLEFSYLWLQQDGNSGGNKYGPGKGTIKMAAAGTTTISRAWDLHLGSTPGDQRWIALAITKPEYVEYTPGQYFTYLCGS